MYGEVGIEMDEFLVLLNNSQEVNKLINLMSRELIIKEIKFYIGVVILLIGFIILLIQITNNKKR